MCLPLGGVSLLGNAGGVCGGEKPQGESDFFLLWLVFRRAGGGEAG